jgi:hypothetical protein
VALQDFFDARGEQQQYPPLTEITSLKKIAFIFTTNLKFVERRGSNIFI